MLKYIAAADISTAAITFPIVSPAAGFFTTYPLYVIIPMIDATMPAANIISGYLAADVAVNVDITPDVSTATSESNAAEHADRIYVST